MLVKSTFISVLFVVAVAAAPLALEAQSLRGSPTAVSRVYRQAQAHDLHFYETSAGVLRAEDRGRFIKLTENSDFEVANVRYPYVLPSTHTFVTRLASQYKRACGERLVVTSAVRPKVFRPSNSISKSVHPTGMAVDLRRPRNSRCRSWLRTTLLSLEGAGVLDAGEEHRPPHFHVAVYPNQYTTHVKRLGGSGTIHIAAAGSSSAGPKYKVRRGDSLWQIARRHGTSVEKLKAANQMKSSKIVVGEVLRIPSGR
jgi:hypothetical protein